MASDRPSGKVNDKQQPAEWWRTAFDERWLAMFADKAKDAPREARGIAKMLAVAPTSKILDLCCGDGRIAVQMAHLGYEVTGLDLSTPLLQAARDRARRGRVPVRWIQRDMRDIGLESEFDAVVSVSSSFGYFQRGEDAKTLISAYTALRQGGTLLLDLENVHFLTQMSRQYGEAPTYMPVDKYRSWIEESTSFDPVSQQVSIIVKLWHDGKVAKEIAAQYTVYSMPELDRLLSECGFSVHNIYGDFKLEPYGIDSPRMIVVCQKTE